MQTMRKEVHNKTGTFETHKDCSRGQDKNVQDKGNTKFVELSVNIHTSNLYSIQYLMIPLCNTVRGKVKIRITIYRDF